MQKTEIVDKRGDTSEKDVMLGVRMSQPTTGRSCPLRALQRRWSRRVPPRVRSKAEIKRVRETFVQTGDDPPAVNAAVRDTLTWVLGGITAEELVKEYCATGEDYQCFTCPRGWPEYE